ncbi:MAG: universal stress protein [Raoultibacter sp.]
MVIIGSRGLSGIKEHLGSMSYKILHGSTAPVLIAK